MPTPKKSFAKAFFEDIKETAPVDNTRTAKPVAIATHYESDAERHRKANNESDARYYEETAKWREENAKEKPTYFDSAKNSGERYAEMNAVKDAHDAAVQAEASRVGGYGKMNDDSISSKGQRFYNEQREYAGKPKVSEQEYNQRLKDEEELESRHSFYTRDESLESAKDLRNKAQEARNKNNRFIQDEKKRREDNAKAQQFEHNLHKYDKKKTTPPKMLQKPKSFAKSFFEDIK